MGAGEGMRQSIVWMLLLILTPGCLRYTITYFCCSSQSVYGTSLYYPQNSDADIGFYHTHAILSQVMPG